ncbi:putative DNA-binding domain-containing protein [Dyella jejuensis]|uniref:DNA-binding domain-containing protein n=1 Tax=Dyella jejuensis TaxID=1432009 RepID=A0ABW8JLM6_9GAMM
MNSLRDIQQHMLQAVTHAKAPVLPQIRSDAIADATSRMDVYRHGYRTRLRDALNNEFAGLRCMAGRHFNALLDAYAEAHPSQHYNIRWHGAGLAAFLDRARPWCGKPQLAEMARLDWAISTAFDAADQPTASLAELAAVPPQAWAGLRLEMQDNLQWLDCRYNVDAFRRAADRGEARPRLRRLARSRYMMIWRHAMTVHYRRLDHDETPVLRAAVQGESFASLCAKLAQVHGEATAAPRMVAWLRTWLDAGLVRGWRTD